MTCITRFWTVEKVTYSTVFQRSSLSLYWGALWVANVFIKAVQFCQTLSTIPCIFIRKFALVLNAKNLSISCLRKLGCFNITFAVERVPDCAVSSTFITSSGVRSRISNPSLSIIQGMARCLFFWLQLDLSLFESPNSFPPFSYPMLLSYYLLKCVLNAIWIFERIMI